jgi:hypothetical protein
MPDEETYPILSVPDTAPKAIEDFVVTLLPPEAGWMTFEIRCDDVILTLAMSYVFSPIDRLKSWLEAVASGEEAWFDWYPEGYLEHLIIKNHSPDGDIVRFTSWMQVHGVHQLHPEWPVREAVIKRGDYDCNTVGSVKLQADVILPRSQFVRAFYEGLLHQWEKPDPRTFWVAWDLLTPEQWVDDGFEEDTGKPYGHWHVSMQSDVIERYLASVSTK